MEAPELLLPELVGEGLQTKVFGKKIHYTEKVDSTNNVAKKLAEEGAEEGTIVLAEEQSGGRGRLERSFLSPFAQGVWFSLILRPTFLPMEVSKMTLLAAVALTKALHKMGLVECGIKWPNDILVKNRKVVGILTELNASMERINYLVMSEEKQATPVIEEEQLNDQMIVRREKMKEFSEAGVYPFGEKYNWDHHAGLFGRGLPNTRIVAGVFSFRIDDFRRSVFRIEP